jgi:pyridoxine kinase
MKSILSLQSHVAYGYVGNRAAVFPLQRLGFEVTALNTVQFSNHTGYGQWQGDIFSVEQLSRLIAGLRDTGVFPRLNALLTGYLGNPALGGLIVELVRELKTLTPDFIYCCDPVMGDAKGGCYVDPGVRSYFKEDLLQVADIYTPNQFELAFLSDLPVTTLAEVQRACDALISRGPHTILVTSLSVKESAPDRIQMLLHQAKGSWLIETPRLAMNPEPNGAGDLTAALLLAHTLEGLSPEAILEKTAAAVFGIYEATFKAGTRELQLIAAQNELVAPSHLFKSIAL